MVCLGIIADNLFGNLSRRRVMGLDGDALNQNRVRHDKTIAKMETWKLEKKSLLLSKIEVWLQYYKAQVVYR